MLCSKGVYLLLILAASIPVAVHGGMLDKHPVMREVFRKITTFWKSEKHDVKSGKRGPTIDGCNMCVWGSCSPSIKPDPNADLHIPTITNDLLNTLSHTLSVSSKAENKERMIKILTKYSEAQRLQISSHLQRTGRGPLDKIMLKLKDDSSFSELMVALSTPLPTFFARQFEKAIADQKSEGKASNGRFIMLEMLVTLPACLIHNIHEAYEAMHGLNSYTTDIVHSLANDYSQPDYIDIFKAIVIGKRDEGIQASWFRALIDARRLKNELERAIERDNQKKLKAFMADLFIKRSIPQLKEIFLIYERLRGETLEKDILKHMQKVTVSEVYVGIINIVKQQSRYFAGVFNNIFQTATKDNDKESRFIGLLRGRCDIDLDDINQTYKNMHGSSLLEDFNSWEKHKQKTRTQFYSKAVSSVIGDNDK